MLGHSLFLLGSSIAAATENAPEQGSAWACVEALLPALAVAAVSAYFQYRMSHQITHLEARLASQTGFFMRKLEAHEKLWPLVAACNRAQNTLSFQKRQGPTDLGPAARQIAECRKQMKNYVYDNGLYFDDGVRHLIQELDTQLGDPNITDVRTATEHVEAKLREVINDIK